VVSTRQHVWRLRRRRVPRHPLRNSPPTTVVTPKLGKSDREGSSWRIHAGRHATVGAASSATAGKFETRTAIRRRAGRGAINFQSCDDRGRRGGGKPEALAPPRARPRPGPWLTIISISRSYRTRSGSCVSVRRGPTLQICHPPLYMIDRVRGLSKTLVPKAGQGCGNAHSAWRSKTDSCYTAALGTTCSTFRLLERDLPATHPIRLAVPSDQAPAARECRRAGVLRLKGVFRKAIRT